MEFLNQFFSFDSPGISMVQIISALSHGDWILEFLAEANISLMLIWDTSVMSLYIRFICRADLKLMSSSELRQTGNEDSTRMRWSHFCFQKMTSEPQTYMLNFSRFKYINSSIIYWPLQFESELERLSQLSGKFKLLKPTLLGYTGIQVILKFVLILYLVL